MKALGVLLLSSLSVLALMSATEASASTGAADATSKPCGPNLISNGSFEKGTTPGEWLTIKTGSSDLDDWTVSKGTVDIVGTLWPASDGDRSIDLDGTSFGAISQDVKTDAGKTYVVTFDFSGNAYGAPTIKTMRLSAGDASAQYSFDVSKRPYRSMGWQTHTWRFVAKGKSTAVEFESLDTENGYYGPVIDNVKVQATCD